MTIQPESRAGHHKARDTQELMDAADRIGERQEELYSRDPSTEQFPTQAQTADGEQVAATPDRQRALQAQQAQQAQPTQQAQGPSHQVQDPRAQNPQAQGMEQAPPMDQNTQAQQSAPADRSMQADSGQAEARSAEHARHDEETSSPRETPTPSPRDHSSQEHGSQEHGSRDHSPHATDDEHVALFDSNEADQLRTRWREVQSAFVDDPRQAVQGADQLVAQVIQSLTASFAAHKKELDGQWQRGDETAGEDGGPATEDLRLALRRYRTLFNQLLNT